MGNNKHSASCYLPGHEPEIEVHDYNVDSLVLRKPIEYHGSVSFNKAHLRFLYSIAHPVEALSELYSILRES